MMIFIGVSVELLLIILLILASIAAVYYGRLAIRDLRKVFGPGPLGINTFIKKHI